MIISERYCTEEIYLSSEIKKKTELSVKFDFYDEVNFNSREEVIKRFSLYNDDWGGLPRYMDDVESLKINRDKSNPNKLYFNDKNDRHLILIIPEIFIPKRLNIRIDDIVNGRIVSKEDMFKAKNLDYFILTGGF